MSRRRAGVAATAVAVAVKRCAIYTRKSPSGSNSDARLTSVEAQRDVGVAYVEARAAEGWRLVPERYDDGRNTGANLDRPAFSRLIADIAARKIDIVVVYKVDRLSRSLLDFAQVMGLFDRHGVAFVSVTQNFSTADAIGRLTLHLLMSFAEFEREMISERTRDKVASARRRGLWTGGPTPLGYRSEGGRLHVDPVTSPVARDAFAKYLETGSIVAVIRLLEQRAPRTRRDGRPRPWDRGAVRRIVDNPVYAGLLRVGTELVRGMHEPLIDSETFNTVHRQRRAAGETQRAVDDPFFLRGLGRCGACGGALVGAETRRRRRRFRYYRCHTRDRRGADACPLTPVRAGDLEDLVLGSIRTRLATTALAPTIVRRAREQLAASIADLTDERQHLPVTLATATARADDVAHLLNGTTPTARTSVEPALTAALADAAAAERRLIAVDAQLARLCAVAQDQDWIAATLTQFDPVWATLTPGERSRLVSAIVHQVVVTPHRTVELRWQPWFEEAMRE